jgi:hypothetical protein
MKFENWSRDDGAYTEYANWLRDWGTAAVYLEEVGDGYEVVLHVKPLVLGGPVGHATEEIIRSVGEAPTQKEAEDIAKDFIEENPDTVFVENEDRDRAITTFYEEKILGDLSSRDFNGIVAGWISRNYHVDVDYDRTKEDDIVTVDGKVTTTLHNEKITLTTSRQRDAIYSTSLNVPGYADHIESVLEDRGLYSDKTYRKISKARVQNDPEYPSIEEEVLERYAEDSGKSLIEKWESPTLRFIEKK